MKVESNKENPAKATINIDELAKDFEKYVKKFEEIRELALRFKTSPGEMVDMFFGIGLEALKRTENVLKNEFESKLQETLGTSLSDAVIAGTPFERKTNDSSDGVPITGYPSEKIGKRKVPDLFGLVKMLVETDLLFNDKDKKEILDWFANE